MLRSRNGHARMLAIAALVGTSGCQPMFNWARAHSSPIDWKGETRIELPLKQDSGGRPNIPVTVVGQDTLMIVDSGSTTPLLARALVSSGNLPTKKRIGSVNGQRLDIAMSVPLHFGAHVMEFNPVVWDHHDPRWAAPVLIGANLLLQAVVDIDFDAKRLSIIQSDAFTPPTVASIPVGLDHGRPTVRLTVSGHTQSICAVIDTGADGGIYLTDGLVQKLGLATHPAGGTTVTLGAATGETWERPILAPLQGARLAHLNLGATSVRHSVRTDACSNVIGMEVLSRYRLIFDLPKRRLWLLPRAA